MGKRSDSPDGIARPGSLPEREPACDIGGTANTGSDLYCRERAPPAAILAEGQVTHEAHSLDARDRGDVGEDKAEDQRYPAD